MRTHDTVVQLNQALAGTRVLSVYLNAEETDPAERRAWRIRLSGMLKALDEKLSGAPAAEREAAHRAALLILQELYRYAGMLPERGWVGFATAERLHYAAPSPAPMPDDVRWEQGAHVAPYLRALKQARPVLVVAADRRHARVLRYRHGELAEEAVLWADTATADAPTEGGSKRAATHSGARGEARGDAARRGEAVATERLIGQVRDALLSSAEGAPLLVVVGAAEVAVALLRELPPRMRERAIEVPGVRADASPAELKEAIEAAASVLSVRLQRALVTDVLETTRADGRACVGPERTDRALRAGAVDTLLVSRSFTRAMPELAERLIDQAFAQGARVEEIAEMAAAELDREGGIGARLRFAA